jgi:hypothetical protein
MSALPLAAVVVEGRYPKLFELPRVRDGWLPDVLARLQIRHREIPIVFADSHKFSASGFAVFSRSTALTCRRSTS